MDTDQGHLKSKSWENETGFGEGLEKYQFLLEIHISDVALANRTSRAVCPIAGMASEMA